MKKINFFALLALLIVLTNSACDNDASTNCTGIITTLPSAFSQFDSNNCKISISGCNVVIETNGMPNHTSPY